MQKVSFLIERIQSTTFINSITVMPFHFWLTPETTVSNADDFKDRYLRESCLSPSPTAWISGFPYTLPLGTFAQDVSPPSVIWVTHPRFH